jgi:hypothetical protein
MILYTDFQIKNLRRQQGRDTNYPSLTDNPLKIFIWKSLMGLPVSTGKLLGGNGIDKFGES